MKGHGGKEGIFVLLWQERMSRESSSNKLNGRSIFVALEVSGGGGLGGRFGSSHGLGVRWHPSGSWRVQFKRRCYEHNYFVNCSCYFRVGQWGFDR